VEGVGERDRVRESDAVVSVDAGVEEAVSVGVGDNVGDDTGVEVGRMAAVSA